MQCVFWRRKLVTSIPTNQTCRPGPLFRGRPIPAMFPVIVSCLQRPRQPFTSLSQPGNPLWRCKRCNWRLVQTPCFSTTLEKGTQAAWDDLACRDTLNSLLNTNNPWNHCRLLAAQESHTAARSVPNCQCWKLAQSRWAPYCNRPPNWCQNPWKLKMPLWQSSSWARAPWPLLY